MTTSDIIYAFLGLLGGMGVFLYGMKLMGDSLENVAGNDIKNMFGKISDNGFLGVGIGLGTTAIIQSSAAVTVMLIGFVNAGFMSLLQATYIIFGANIGTTVTAQIVALGYGGMSNIDMTTIFATCAGIGALTIMFAKKDKVKKIGAIITGLGMIFVGLAVMGSSMKVFSTSAEITAFVAQFTNSLLLVLFGLLFTALIQSSSAVSGLVITMCAAGIISFEQAMYIVVGSNVGTCVTAIIGSIGTNTNARRVACVHLLFNVTGVTMFLLSDLIFNYAAIFDRLFDSPTTRIAMLHTFFNVATTILLFPLAKCLVWLATRLIKSKPESAEDKPHLAFIEEHMLATPPIAVSQTKKEVLNMAKLAKTNFDAAINATLTLDLGGIEAFEKTEKTINFINREMVKFLVRLSHTDLSYIDKTLLGTSYHTISDIERIGDYAENIIEYAVRLKESGGAFSDDAKAEISEMQSLVTELYNLVIDCYKNENIDLIPKINHYEERVDNLNDLMAENHIKRLDEGTCTPETGALYLSLASNSERVADHLTNIALAVRSYARPKKN